MQIPDNIRAKQGGKKERQAGFFQKIQACSHNCLTSGSSSLQLPLRGEGHIGERVSASCPAIQLMIFASVYLKLRWETDCIQRQNEVGEAHLRLPKDSADTRKRQRDQVWGPQPEYPRG